MQGKNVPGSGLTCLLLATQCTESPPSPSHAACSLRLLVGAFPAACRSASCLPVQLLAVFHFFLRLLACNSACSLSFVRLLAGPLRLLAFLLGCLPGLRAAFPLHGLLALPGSSGASHSLLARCLCLLVRLSCVVLFVSLFICCQLLLHPHVGLALRLVRMNCF